VQLCTGRKVRLKLPKQRLEHISHSPITDLRDVGVPLFGLMLGCPRPRDELDREPKPIEQNGRRDDLTVARRPECRRYRHVSWLKRPGPLMMN
jgi:hypothetical protein